jgi:hypothetical protein
MAINISHPTNTIDGQDVLNLKSGNSSNIELTPDSGLVNVNGDINITGNFSVQGTVTTVNSTTTSIVDPIIVLGTDVDGNPVSTNDGKDRGVSFFYNNGSSKTGFFGFDSSNNDFRFIPDATISNEIVTGADGTITINRLNSIDVYTDYLEVAVDAAVHGDLTVDNKTTTTTLDAGDLNITTNVVSSTISGNIVLDPGSDSIDVSDSNIINLAEPNNLQDAATKNYVDQATNAISSLSIAGDFGTGSINLETGTFTLNGTEYQIKTTITDDVITISLPTTLVAPGSLEVTTNLLVSENTTTTTLDAGNLNITTNVISSDVSGDIIIDSGSDNIELIGNTNVTGNLDVSGNITLGGNITIGDQTVDTVSVVADFTSNLIPQTDSTYDLGSSSKKWDNLYATTVNANLTGDVTGQVSDISNHSTSDLSEGTNKYYTDTRARLSVSATDAGGDGSFSYNNLTGEFTYTGPSATETRAHFSAGTGLTYNAGEFKISNTNVNSGTYGSSSKVPQLIINDQGQITSATEVSVAGVTNFEYDSTTADLTITTADGGSFVATVDLSPFTTSTLAEGTNKYYLDSRARASVSVTKISGDGNLTYNNTTGVFEYTGPNDSEIRNHFSAGTGVNLDFGTGIISIGQEVETTSNVEFNNVDTVTLDAGNLNITTNVISSDISGDIEINSGSDNIELIGNTNVTGDLSVSANTIIYGDLTVQGTTTSINSTDTEISDNTITLNQGETGAGVSKGTSGIEVARGSFFNASWKWNELTNSWEAKEGSNLTTISAAGINAGNVNIANNTIAPTNTNGDLNLNSDGTGKVLINGRQAATDTDALMYAIVFGG